MTWIKAWRIGRTVLKILGAAGIRVKGKSVAEIDRVLGEALTTKSTVQEITRRQTGATIAEAVFTRAKRS